MVMVWVVPGRTHCDSRVASIWSGGAEACCCVCAGVPAGAACTAPDFEAGWAGTCLGAGSAPVEGLGATPLPVFWTVASPVGLTPTPGGTAADPWWPSVLPL